MNYYQVLGVDESASVDEVKKIYKKLAKEWHPDVNSSPDAEEKFKEISAAYSTLSDPGKRAEYDRSLRAPNFNNPFEGFDGNFGGFPGGFSHFDFFAQEMGSNLHVQATLAMDFLDARYDQQRTVQFDRHNACQPCQGTGVKTYSKTHCSLCKGKGKIIKNYIGLLQAAQTCNRCKGKGFQPELKCNNCTEGQISETVQITVNIPSGILEGKTLRVAGEGHRNQDGKGDLLLRVQIKPSSKWQRQGPNVISSIAVPYPTLVNGGTVEVETIWGKEAIKIAPKTKAGSAQLIYGAGFPRLGKLMPNERGVHHITLDLMLPTINTQEHTDLLNRLGQLYASS